MLERLDGLRAVPENQTPAKREAISKIEIIFLSSGLKDVEPEKTKDDSLNQYIFSTDQMRFNPNTGEVEIKGGGRCQLTRRETEVFTVLIRNRGRVVTKEQFIIDLWGGHLENENLLKKNIQRIRQKLEPGTEPENCRFIRTVHGFGYLMPRDGDETSQSASGS